MSNIIDLIGVYEIPTYALAYLIYGDPSGLSDDDQAIIDHWVVNEFDDYHSIVFDVSGGDDNYTGFCTVPAFGLPCDTETVPVYGYRLAVAS